MRTNKSILTAAIMTTVITSQVAAEDFQLEEIVVTAQKKSESLMDVPVTVTAVTAETLDNIGVFDLTDLAKATSGLQVTTNGDVALRGIDSGLGSFTAGQRVTTYLNGSYVGNQDEFWLTNYDLDRIEILRGPQGTLYGASSPTGAIVAYTKKPSLSESEGYIRHSFGEHNLSNTQFAYGAPIIEDKLAIRIAGNYDENNSLDGEYLNGPEFLQRTESGRFSVLWTPTDSFDAHIVHTYTDRNSNNANFVVGNGLTAKDRVSAGSVESVRQERINTTVLTLNWNLDFADFTSQSYYSESDLVIPSQDADNTPTDYQVSAATGDVRTYNHEFRLSSLDNDNWDWVIGSYHSISDSTIGIGQTFQNGFIDASFVNGFFPAIYIDSETDFRAVTDSHTEFNALFTHNTFYLAEDWTLIAGIRWNKGRSISNISGGSDLLFDQTNVTGFGPIASSLPIETDNDVRKDVYWTGTAKLQYSINEDQNVYFTYDRGFRQGSNTADFTGSIARLAPEKLLFENETTNSFELGYKASLLDNRLNLTSALFYTVYKDFQVSAGGTTTDGGNDAFVSFIDNAPEVSTEGIDLEVNYLASEGLLLSASVSYVRSKFEDYSEAPVVSEGAGASLAAGEFATQDLTGKDVGGLAPRLSATFSANYSRTVNFMSSEWYLTGLMNYGGTRTDPFSDRATGGFSTFDLSTGLRTSDWDLRLWVKNVFDKDAALTAAGGYDLNVPNSAIFPGFPTALAGAEVPSGYQASSAYTNPRQIGVTASYTF